MTAAVVDKQLRRKERNNSNRAVTSHSFDLVAESVTSSLVSSATSFAAPGVPTTRMFYPRSTLTDGALLL